MKPTIITTSSSSLLGFLLIFFLQIGSPWAQDDSQGCLLDFTNYPYEPTGLCLSSKGKVKAWGAIETHSCCLNALNSLSQALALHASEKDSIFLDQQGWDKCNSSAFPRQPDVTFEFCGFENLSQSNDDPCSLLSLSHMRSKEERDMFGDLVAHCSEFGYTTFNSNCRACVDAFTTTLVNVTNYYAAKVNNDEHMAKCAVALAVFLTSNNYQNKSWVLDFYNCMPALDNRDPGIYIKIADPLLKAIMAIAILMISLLLVIMLVKFVQRKKTSSSKHKTDGKEALPAWSGLYRFSKAEIEAAMNFSNHKVSLGAGSAGRVYKGVLPSGQLIAIKHIYKSNTSDCFTREVEGLSRIRHPNLVGLFGCCVEGGDQYLVYEYCSYGNLAQQLLRSDSVLKWKRRVKILRDSSLALRFLHHYPDGCIVHRDIKLTNILLTENMDAKLSDFGLAKMLGMHETKVFTDVRGTIGYMDPEYVTNAKLTCASDVYGFGIVILQMLSGRKVIELDLEARDNLTKKAKDVVMEKRPLVDIIDPRLNGDFHLEDFKSLLQIAVLCVARSSKGRPNMDQIFEELEKAWNNINAINMVERGRSEANTSITPQSRSLEVLAV